MQIKSSYHNTKGFPAFFVPQAGRHCTLWVPHGKSGHDDPKNGKFIQKLSEEREGGVKVGRAGADDDEEGPDDVNPVTHTGGVRLLKILILLIDKLPTQCSDQDFKYSLSWQKCLWNVTTLVCVESMEINVRISEKADYQDISNNILAFETLNPKA